MRAVAFEKPGAPDVMGVFELPAPELGPEDVLIRVAFATVNPSDVLVRSGTSAFMLEGSSSPYVLGWDLSGVVERVGSEVTDFSAGDQVVACTDWPRTHRGAQAELVALPSRRHRAAWGGMISPFAGVGGTAPAWSTWRAIR